MIENVRRRSTNVKLIIILQFKTPYLKLVYPGVKIKHNNTTPIDPKSRLNEGTRSPALFLLTDELVQT